MDNGKQQKETRDHWHAQRKKARKTALILGVLALALAAWSVFVVLQKAAG